MKYYKLYMTFECVREPSDELYEEDREGYFYFTEDAPTSKQVDEMIDYYWDDVGDVYVTKVDYTLVLVTETEVKGGMIRTVEL